ncbi:MAG TPA: nicotinate-nucleotide adenylyltransferase [Wenzhouxiangella sp.]|nr:nicotinate-nucleotide adenylyltransferase [Wenzhouxiangella sp.]
MNRLTVMFGGTFDPVHFGHLRAASEINEQLGADDFRLIPAGRPDHRQPPDASARHRLAMLRLALSAWPDLRVDAREVQRPGSSWTVETLESLRNEIGAERPLAFCVGQDAANQLHRWHRWRDLLDLAHLVIMRRPQSRADYAPEAERLLSDRRVDGSSALLGAASGSVLRLEITPLAISSTAIRALVAKDKNPRFLLPDSVLGYIREHDLYGAAESRRHKA